MRKICFLSLFVIFSPVMFAESFTQNEHLLAAQDFLDQSIIAFDKAQYNEALDFITKVGQELDASDRYIHDKIIKIAASKSITQAKERLKWAESIDGPKNFPLSYEAATEAITVAETSFAEEDYDTADAKAKEAIDLVGTMKEVAKHFAFVRWRTHNDFSCDFV